MSQYANDFRFEEAMTLRDRIKTIEKSQIKSGIDLATNEDIDIFAITASNKKAVVVRMFLRDGKLASSSHDFLKVNNFDENFDFDYNEAYKRAIINYYDNEIPLLPKEILTGIELEDVEELEDFLQTRFSKKIKVLNPKKDKKKDIVQIALNNCDELLRIDSSRNQTTIYEELKDLFGLETLPYLIESYDNSHMMGQATVGAMVVWNEDINAFDKKAFRHYNLESKDEYSQMREMLIRRVENFEKNPAPDLWIIDGGETLLKLAYDIVQSVGVNLDIIAVAKEKVDAKAHRAKGAAKDIIHYKTKNGEFKNFKLSTSDKRLQFVQRQRDEAHRFVINFHKKQKRAQDKQISLLQIKGIGEAKIKKLLLYFGEFEKIRNASAEELKNVLNEKDALTIANYFINPKD